MCTRSQDSTTACVDATARHPMCYETLTAVMILLFWHFDLVCMQTCPGLSWCWCSPTFTSTIVLSLSSIARPSISPRSCRQYAPPRRMLSSEKHCGPTALHDGEGVESVLNHWAGCVFVSESRLPRQTQSRACATTFELGREVDTGQVCTDGPRWRANLSLLVLTGLLESKGLSLDACIEPLLQPALYPVLVYSLYTRFPLGPVRSTHHTHSRPSLFNSLALAQQILQASRICVAV